MWIVTNRHVLLPKHGDVEVAPTSVTFRLRRLNDAGVLVWDPVTLSVDHIEQLARFHPNRAIDVATLDIHDLMFERLNSGNQYAPNYGLSSDRLAGKNKISVEASSDVLVVGYPRGFYDDVNLYPVIKSGIIASRWGVGFRGNRYFLIDAKLFPGSSGSVVLSKPIDFQVKDGKMMYSQEKQFAFLGVFSGEPYLTETPIELDDMIIIQKSGFNLGVVWYAELVDEILGNGVPISEAFET